MGKVNTNATSLNLVVINIANPTLIFATVTPLDNELQRRGIYILDQGTPQPKWGHGDPKALSK